MNKQTLLLILLLFGFQMVGGADEAQTVSISFRILPWGMTTENLYVHNGGKYENLMAVPSNISRQYEYHGTNPMRIYRRVDSAQEKGGEVYELACEVSIDPNRSNSLLIVLEVEDGSLRGVFYPFDVDAYGGSTFVLFNFTPGPIQVKMGDERVLVKSTQLHRFEAGRMPSDAARGVRCRIAYPHGESWRLVYNKMVYLLPEGRIFAFVSQRGLDSQPNIKIVRDFMVNDATRESRDRAIWMDDQKAAQME